MNYLSTKIIVITFAAVFALSAQSEDGTSDNPFGGDPFGGLSGDSIPPPIPESSDDPYGTSSGNAGQSSSQDVLNPVDQVPLQDNLNQTTNVFSEIESSGLDSPVQNAIIEGIQITSDKGSTPDEKVVSGYFIFRDKPSSYFYEVKLREKKIVFEFNDTKTGVSPVPSVSESPIKGFTIVSDRVDVNKDVKGLKPEYHNLIRVIFDLEGVPEIRVNDEYSIITFSFKWTNNPDLISKYTVKNKTPKIILWSSTGVGVAAAAGIAVYFATKPQPVPPLGPLDISDLPDHQ